MNSKHSLQDSKEYGVQIQSATKYGHEYSQGKVSVICAAPCLKALDVV